MPWPLVRIDLDERSRDFQRMVLQPGFPILDRFSANSHTVRQWLGRFAADAVWDGATVRFLLSEEANSAPPRALKIATLSDLQGSLRGEIEALQSQLKRAAAKTPNERMLLVALQKRLDKALSDNVAVSGAFFKYKGRGGSKLVWCWGYERRHSGSSPLRLCVNDDCRLAFFDGEETRHRCPRCGKKCSSNGLQRSFAAALVLLLIGVGGVFGWKWLAPGSTVIEGDVVDAITGRPIENARFQPLEGQPSEPPIAESNSDAAGHFRVTNSVPIRWQVTADGYQSSIWEAPAKEKSSERPRIALRGAADLSGLVVEEGTDRPIPFPKIQVAKTGHETVGDDVGLFLVPGVPSGDMELDIQAEGYRTRRIERTFGAGGSSDLLITLTGAASVSGTVLDAFDKRVVAGAVIRIAGLPNELHSDDKGQFRQEALPGKSCRLEITAPGYFTREFERELSATSENSLRFLLRPELTALTGIVVDSSGTPIENAEVGTGGDRLPVKTTVDGRFKLNSLRRGPLSLRVTANGYRPSETELNVPTISEEPTRIALSGAAKLVVIVTDATKKSPIPGAEVRVAVDRWKTTTNADGKAELDGLPTGTVPVEVIGLGYRAAQLQPELTASVSEPLMVELRGATVLSGLITSAFDGKPIVDSEVQLEGAPITTTTNSEGRYRFEDVVAGVNKLTVSARGYQPVTHETETRVDQENTLDLQLKGAVTLNGRVQQAESDQPIAKASVTLGGVNRKLTTNEQGEFVLTDLPAQSFQVSAMADGFLSNEVEVDLSTLPLPELVLRLKPPHKVRGVVLDARSKKPVAAAKVTLSGHAEPTVSDAEGRFQFSTARASSYEFAVSAHGYRPQSFIERPASNGNSREVVAAAQPGQDSDSEPVFQLPLTIEGDSIAATDLPEGSDTKADAPRETAKDETAAPPGSVDDFGLPPPQPRDPLDVEFFGSRTKASQVGFVVDNSGSMDGDRLKRTKIELLKAVLYLHPKQTFYVAFFNDQPVPMFGDANSLPLLASPVNKVRAYKWLTTITATGGTEPQATLQMVSKMSPQAIYLLTDGGFSPLSEDTFTGFQLNKTRVNTLAFEDETGKAVLQDIAKRTGGTYRFIPKAPLCDLCELSLVTSLFDELLEAWLEPKTESSERNAAHLALIEFCDGQDFGPRVNVSESDRRKARTFWQQWWVENKLAPAISGQSEDRILRNFQNPNFWWRWASVEAARQKGLSDVGPFISKVRDTNSGVNQAARRALVAVAKDEDYGPAEDADSEACRVAHDRWTEWWRRERYIASLSKRGDEQLAQEFENPDPRTRRAAVRTAADRGHFSLPDPLIARLDDEDEQVRRNANEAMAKISGRNFDPSGGRDRASSAAAAKEYRKWRNEKAEKEAEKTMRLAETLDKAQRHDAAKQWYQRVADTFPNTNAASKAVQRIKALSP